MHELIMFVLEYGVWIAVFGIVWMAFMQFWPG